MNVLDGVRVVEVGSYITAPYCGMLLADLGADVIKVESPDGGDPFRSFKGGLYSPHFAAFNKNKRSVALDLRSPEGLEALFALLAEADVFLENFRPGAGERLGLGWAALHERFPRLIHCSITGFGPDGPYRHRPAYDTVISSLSGMLSLTLDPAHPILSGATVADNVTGMTACYGVQGALYERTTSNVGRHVEVHMLEALIAFFPEFFVALGRGQKSDRFSRASASQSWTLLCADSKILSIHLSSPEKFWQGAVRAFERPELADDPRFRVRPNRIENYLALGAELQAVAITQPRAYWVARLEEFEVPYAPVHLIEDVPDDPQVRAMDTFYRARHPVEGEVLSVRRPVYFDGSREIAHRPPPALGEHNGERFAQTSKPSPRGQR